MKHAIEILEAAEKEILEDCRRIFCLANNGPGMTFEEYNRRCEQVEEIREAVRLLRLQLVPVL